MVAPTIAPTIAQTIDQTAPVGGDRGRPMAPQPRMDAYALPPQTGPALGGQWRAPAPALATKISPGRIGMFVALGFVALLVLATAGGVAARVSGSLPGKFTAASNVAVRSREISRSVCTGSLAGKWSDGPCDRAGAKFGCRSAGSTSWFYAPFTADQANANCPATLGVIVTP